MYYVVQQETSVARSVCLKNPNKKRPTEISQLFEANPKPKNMFPSTTTNAYPNLLQ